MTLLLSGSDPHAEIKSGFACLNDVILFRIKDGDRKLTTEFSMDDFCDMVSYVMTNTDLAKNDPRPELIKRLNKLITVDGYNKGNKRLQYPM